MEDPVENKNIIFIKPKMDNMDSKNVSYKSYKCLYTAVTRKVHTPSREERRFLYFNHLSKEFLEQMIPHLKALI